MFIFGLFKDNFSAFESFVEDIGQRFVGTLHIKNWANANTMHQLAIVIKGLNERISKTFDFGTNGFSVAKFAESPDLNIDPC